MSGMGRCCSEALFLATVAFYHAQRDSSTTPTSGTSPAPFDFATAGDLGPEGLTFIDAHDSPNDKPLLVVANEISGSTTIFEINRVGRHSPKGKGNPKK